MGGHEFSKASHPVHHGCIKTANCIPESWFHCPQTALLGWHGKWEQGHSGDAVQESWRWRSGRSCAWQHWQCHRSEGRARPQCGEHLQTGIPGYPQETPAPMLWSVESQPIQPALFGPRKRASWSPGRKWPRSMPFHGTPANTNQGRVQREGFSEQCKKMQQEQSKASSPHKNNQKQASSFRTNDDRFFVFSRSHLGCRTIRLRAGRSIHFAGCWENITHNIRINRNII